MPFEKSNLVSACLVVFMCSGTEKMVEVMTVCEEEIVDGEGGGYGLGSEGSRMFDKIVGCGRYWSR